MVFVNIKQTTGSHRESRGTILNMLQEFKSKAGFSNNKFCQYALDLSLHSNLSFHLVFPVIKFTEAVSQKQENALISEFGGQRSPFWNGMVIRHNMIIDVLFLIK